MISRDVCTWKCIWEFLAVDGELLRGPLGGVLISAGRRIPKVLYGLKACCFGREDQLALLSLSSRLGSQTLWTNSLRKALLNHIPFTTHTLF